METEEIVYLSDDDAGVDDNRIELLPHEQTIMLDTMNDDVLFISGKGLGIERLCLHHLHMYSDPKLLLLVINTSPADEHFFLNKLKEMNPNCPPKLINSDVHTNQREAVYLDGGVQFITSRVLMLDLLTDRVPVKNVTGIIVYRAHEILRSFQESFILRLYREKKSDGFVKAFTDNPTAITSGGIGQLQRLFDKLYVKNVRLLPRFDSVIKETFDQSPPKLCELDVELPVTLRKVRMGLMDIIRTCVKELKQTVHSLEIEMEDDALSPSAALYPSKLELDLRKKTLLLSERQERILNDLGLLRALLRKVEDLDPYTAFKFVHKLRTSKEIIENNSGWLFTQTASKIFSGLESLCKTKMTEDSTPMIGIPPKWDGLKTALSEITLHYPDSDEKVFIIAPSEECCRQLVDVIKFGDKKFQWLLTKSMMNEKDATTTPGREPASQGWWNPESLVLYDTQLNFKSERKDLVNKLQNEQKKATSRKRQKIFPPSADLKKMKQSSLVNFGIVKYKEKKEQKEEQKSAASPEESSKTDNNDDDAEFVSILPSETMGCSAFVVLLSHGDTYNLINALENLKPRFVILYHLDIASMRIIETYNALYPEKNLKVYTILYKESAEEERYLLSLRKEQTSFEMLIREQGVLMVPTEYDVSRESTTKLRQLSLAKDSRNAVTAKDETNKVIIDMREFNSELPTVLYRRGVDLISATLEVGDYILAPTICVERKALDDLAQSLNNGRIFKQLEQMLRHYSRCVLLIESNEKFKHRKVNGGPFQGELSRRSRETRALLTMVVRANPKMAVIWSSSPRVSAELFEEIKLDQPNPNVDTAVAITSHDVGTFEANITQSSQAPSSTKEKYNPVIKKQLSSLPNLAEGDVKKLMTSFKTPQDLVAADLTELSDALDNPAQATALHTFFNTDFRYSAR